MRWLDQAGVEITPVQAALRLMDEEGWQEYLRLLRQRDAPDAWDLYGQPFLRSDPGHPLGVGYPLGRTLREDGESHYEWWQRVTRQDPCAYCDRRPSGTVDHIEPKSLPVRGLGGAHSWLNVIGACENCNGSKARQSLLHFLWERRRRYDRRMARAA